MWSSKPQPVVHRRTTLAALAGLAVVALSGCGFKLRGSQVFAFQTLAVTPERNGLVAADLIRYFGKSIVPLVPTPGTEPPQVIVDILQEARDKNVVGVNASGQVREFQLRLRLLFRVRLPDGRALISPPKFLSNATSASMNPLCWPKRLKRCCCSATCKTTSCSNCCDAWRPSSR